MVPYLCTGYYEIMTDLPNDRPTNGRTDRAVGKKKDDQHLRRHNDPPPRVAARGGCCVWAFHTVDFLHLDKFHPLILL